MLRKTGSRWMKGREGRTSSRFLEIAESRARDDPCFAFQPSQPSEMLPLKTLSSSPLLGKRLISAWANVKQGPPDAILGEKQLSPASLHPT